MIPSLWRAVLAKFKLSSLPIRKKLLLLAVVIYASACAVIIGSGLIDAAKTISNAKKDTAGYVEGLAAQQEQIAVSTQYLLSSLALFPAVQELDADACNALFHETVKQHPFYAAIGATTRDGKVFAASPPFDENLSDRKYIRDAIETRQFSIGEFTVGRISHVPSLHFAYPVLDPDGNLVAVLIAAFRLDVYAAAISGLKLPEGSVITLTDHKGVCLFRSPSDPGVVPGKPIAQRRTCSGSSPGSPVRELSSRPERTDCRGSTLSNSFGSTETCALNSTSWQMSRKPG
jgi:C4-dicarboxylate-specific signal transduction histidine kinase